MMHMTFYWGYKVTILFDSWRTDSWTSYGFSLLACLVFSVFYQYLENLRLRFKQVASGAAVGSGQSTSPIETPLLNSKIAGGRWRPAKFGGAILFGVNSAIGYMLMLAVMSFNWGVFIAIVLGLSIGYLVFRSGDEEAVVVDSPCACA